MLHILHMLKDDKFLRQGSLFTSVFVYVGIAAVYIYIHICIYTYIRIYVIAQSVFVGKKLMLISEVYYQGEPAWDILS
jgi:hypothetical protein